MLQRESKPVTATVATTHSGIGKLATTMVRWSLFNFVLVALLGVLLRAAPLLEHFPLVYKNLLHGHSHFAFGGCVMPLLIALLLQSFPQLAQAVAYRHWRNISIAVLVSAFGMLLSFPVQGYAAVSIAFSTLSLAAGWYLTIVVWRALDRLPQSVPFRFLRSALIFYLIASIGPVALGPIIALGYQGTPVYQHVIYFYLHFTYNGWFLFAVLAIWYSCIDRNGQAGSNVWSLLHYACIPAYALSVLWNRQPIWMYYVGGIAAAAQLVAGFYFLRDRPLSGFKRGWVRRLLWLSVFSFVSKHVLQALSALPAFAADAALHRNLVIAYLHLVLVGCISVFLIAQVLRQFSITATRLSKAGLILFLLCFTTTEVLLALNGHHIFIPYSLHWLAAFAVGMLIGAITFLAGIKWRNVGLFNGKAL